MAAEGQSGVVKYLVDNRAQLDAKNKVRIHMYKIIDIKNVISSHCNIWGEFEFPIYVIHALKPTKAFIVITLLIWTDSPIKLVTWQVYLSSLFFWRKSAS